MGTSITWSLKISQTEALLKSRQQELHLQATKISELRCKLCETEAEEAQLHRLLLTLQAKQQTISADHAECQALSSCVLSQLKLSQERMLGIDQHHTVLRLRIDNISNLIVQEERKCGKVQDMALKKLEAWNKREGCLKDLRSRISACIKQQELSVTRLQARSCSEGTASSQYACVGNGDPQLSCCKEKQTTLKELCIVLDSECQHMEKSSGGSHSELLGHNHHDHHEGPACESELAEKRRLRNRLACILQNAKDIAYLKDLKKARMDELLLLRIAETHAALDVKD